MKAGTATLLTGVGLLLTGLFFGSPPVELPGLALIVLSLAMRLWVFRSAKHLTIELQPGATTTIEGEPYEVSVRIQGTGRFTPGGWVKHPLLLRSRLELGTPLPSRAHLSLQMQRRGRRHLGAPTLVLADPLGQKQQTIQGEDTGRVLVLPRVEPVELAEQHGGAEGVAELAHLESLLDGSASVRSAGMDVDVDGLRPHQPGSPSSRIHWPTVARTGEMFERRLVANADGGPLILLDTRDPDGEDELDKAVRATASLCLALGRAGGCSLILSGRDRPMTIDRGLRSWPAAHAALALIGPTSRGPALRARQLDAAFWVTASASVALPTTIAKTTYVVSPGAPPRAAAFTVAGCSGWRASRVELRKRALTA